MLICLEGILTQARMGVGCVALPSKGPMRGQYIFFMENLKVFISFLFILNTSGGSVPISLTWLRLLVCLKTEWGRLDTFAL